MRFTQPKQPVSETPRSQHAKPTIEKPIFYRRRVNEWLAHHLDGWTSDGTISFEDLYARYGLLGPLPERAVALNRLYSHLYEAART